MKAYQLPMTFDRVYGVTDSNYAILGSGSLIYMLNLA